ncbi:hypothetical protein WICPIJ_004277 [Wickerhamomyces pijperi]|uniref:Uncharacterized protein n=1 Tax=Wickerhamomyces pijperi TaxID=599730 RepID=A0A9P8Q660_WICPI|nr:hypothetical protein WICPIJ_004277 [Wickerhamomyces pijperi]
MEPKMAAMMKVHLLPKLFWIAVKHWVPIAAPALPKAADKPYKVPLTGVAKDSEEAKPIQLPGPKLPKELKIP